MDARGRSLSLINLHLPGDNQRPSTTEMTNQQRSTSTSMLLRQSPDSRDVATPGDIDLLDHGSPMSNDGGDPALLDEDSNDSTPGSVEPAPVNSDQMMVDNAECSTINDPVYHQCRVARQSTFQDKLVSISANDSFGSTVLHPSVAVGSLCDHPNVEKTFHGSRLFIGNSTANQSISASFDPAHLVCVSCKREHGIVTGNPVTILFSDQNFVATVEHENGQCLNIVRLEDASLMDLLNLSKEMFGGTALPDGSVFLFGSASYLSRVGSGTYAKDWSH
jgi:hypothetical protein